MVSPCGRGEKTGVSHGEQVAPRSYDRPLLHATPNSAAPHPHCSKSCVVIGTTDSATERPQGCVSRLETCRHHPFHGRACTIARARMQLISGVASIQGPYTGYLSASTGDVWVGPRRSWHAPAGGGGILGGPAHRHPNGGAAGPSLSLCPREAARPPRAALPQGSNRYVAPPAPVPRSFWKQGHAACIPGRFGVRLRCCSAGRKHSSATPSVCSVS